MIPAYIFREYDIRGLHETELTDEAAEAVGRAFGTLTRRAGGRRVALGWDVRPSSVRLAASSVSSRSARPRMSYSRKMFGLITSPPDPAPPALGRDRARARADHARA